MNLSFPAAYVKIFCWYTPRDHWWNMFLIEELRGLAIYRDRLAQVWGTDLSRCAGIHYKSRVLINVVLMTTSGICGQGGGIYWYGNHSRRSKPAARSACGWRVRGFYRCEQALNFRQDRDFGVVAGQAAEVSRSDAICGPKAQDRRPPRGTSAARPVRAWKR